MKSLIGIFTRPSDDHLGRVVTELEKRCLPWIRFDTLDFPQTLRLAARFESKQRGWQGDFVLNHMPYQFEQLRSIWYRRPTKQYEFPPELSVAGFEFAKAEAQKGFGGLLHGLSTFWVSHPDRIRAAEWKPKQLDAAQHVGLSVPKTLITNDPQAALDFFEECEGEIIYKPFNQGVPRPKIGEPWQGAIYTTKLTRTTLQEYASGIALTACLFQQYIPKHLELRITVIGTQIFAAEIHAHSQRSATDFRRDYASLSYAVHHLPEEVHTRCLALVRYLGLAFAAIDMILMPDGRYVFLESNACGQWGWIEQHTGLPLTATLVDLLANAALHHA